MLVAAGNDDPLEGLESQLATLRVKRVDVVQKFGVVLGRDGLHDAKDRTLLVVVRGPDRGGLVHQGGRRDLASHRRGGLRNATDATDAETPLLFGSGGSLERSIGLDEGLEVLGLSLLLCEELLRVAFDGTDGRSIDVVGVQLGADLQDPG